MYFKDVIGHKNIIENLITIAKSKNVSHAYIFDGEEGIGKSTVAEIFAQAILCQDFCEDNCGHCKSCRLTFNKSHPDVKIYDFTVGEDGKERASISVESVRQFKKEIYLKPFFADRKIYILENADKMTVEAQNAMLKIFEEPPSYITIILITNGISKILSTIKSRAVIIKFPSLKSSELEKYLEKNIAETENKKVYASISGGSIKRMLELIDDENSLILRREVIEGIKELIESSSPVSYNTIYNTFMSNKDIKDSIIDMFMMFIMDIVHTKFENEDKIINIDMTDELKKIALKVNVISINKIENYLFDLKKKIEGNANYKLTVLASLLNIWEELHG